MAKYRPFQCTFWTDPDFEKLTAEEKLVYIFFFTNNITTESGIYQVSEKFISERTNINISKINNIIKSLSSVYNKITYINNTVFVHGFMNRNYKGNPSLLEKSIAQDFKNYPVKQLWEKFLSIYKNHCICNKIKELLNTYQSVNDTSYEDDNESRNDINSYLKEGMQGEIPDQPIESPTWRTLFDEYQKSELSAYTALIKNTGWLEQQEKIKPFPNMNILKTIERAHLNFWSKESGWKNKKKSRSKEIDWPATYSNAIGMKSNQVFDERNKQHTQKPDEDRWKFLEGK